MEKQTDLQGGADMVRLNKKNAILNREIIGLKSKILSDNQKKSYCTNFRSKFIRNQKRKLIDTKSMIWYI